MSNEFNMDDVRANRLAAFILSQNKGRPTESGWAQIHQMAYRYLMGFRGGEAEEKYVSLEGDSFNEIIARMAQNPGE